MRLANDSAVKTVGAVAFAFADGDGRRVLALTPVSKPKEATQAICPGGKVFGLEYAGRKETTAQNTGRAVAGNFDHYGGDLFRIVGGEIEPDATCLIVEQDFSATNLILKPLPLNQATCDGEVTERIALAKEREIAECWRLVALGPARHELLLVEFERVATDALASLVLVRLGGLVFRDYPAEYDRVSTWRVDDGGLLVPEWFRILFGYETGSAIGFALSWYGPEGANITLYAEREGSFETVADAYRYWAPL